MKEYACKICGGKTFENIYLHTKCFSNLLKSLEFKDDTITNLLKNIDDRDKEINVLHLKLSESPLANF